MALQQAALGQSFQTSPEISVETQNEMKIYNHIKLKIPYKVLPESERNFYQLIIVIKMNLGGIKSFF